MLVLSQLLRVITGILHTHVGIITIITGILLNYNFRGQTFYLSYYILRTRIRQ